MDFTSGAYNNTSPITYHGIYNSALGIILGFVLDWMIHFLITSLPVAENVYDCPWDYIGFCPRLNDSFLDNITACSENVYDVGVTIVFIRMIHSMYDSTI